MAAAAGGRAHSCVRPADSLTFSARRLPALLPCTHTPRRPLPAPLPQRTAAFGPPLGSVATGVTAVGQEQPRCPQVLVEGTSSTTGRFWRCHRAPRLVPGDSCSGPRHQLTRGHAMETSCPDLLRSLDRRRLRDTEETPELFTSREAGAGTSPWGGSDSPGSIPRRTRCPGAGLGHQETPSSSARKAGGPARPPAPAPAPRGPSGLSRLPPRCRTQRPRPQLQPQRDKGVRVSCVPHTPQSGVTLAPQHHLVPINTRKQHGAPRGPAELEGAPRPRRTPATPEQGQHRTNAAPRDPGRNVPLGISPGHCHRAWLAAASCWGTAETPRASPTTQD